MGFQNNTNKNSKSSSKKIWNAVIGFFRYFGPQKQGIDVAKMKSLTFDSLRLIGNKQKKIDDINEDAGNLIKQHLDNVSGLLEFIRNRGTRVIQHKHADKVLSLFGELEGFKPPTSGFKARILTLGLKIVGAWKEPIASQTPPLFIFGEKEPPMGYMVHQIHHWLSYNNQLPGYTEEAMNNFKRIFDPSFGVEDVRKMSKEEIIALREAIARDQEALDFVQKMAQEIFKPQDIMKGIKDGDRKNI
jgi:hypothetical protein